MRASLVARAVLLAAALLIVAALPAQAAARVRTGPDSFLTYEVYNLAGFMAEAERDPVLRKRLAKHFRMSEAQLLTYLRSELREVTIESPGVKVVYGVNWIGRIYEADSYFRQGAKALGLADGTPLFKLPCGNPIKVEVRPIEEVVLSPPPQCHVPAAPPIEVPLESAVYVSPAEYAARRDIPLAPVFRVPVTTTSARFIPFWLPPTGGGGHGPPPPPPPPEVPEPASIFLMGAGLAALGGGAIRRRR